MGKKKGMAKERGVTFQSLDLFLDAKELPSKAVPGNVAANNSEIQNPTPDVCETSRSGELRSLSAGFLDSEVKSLPHSPSQSLQIPARKVIEKRSERDTLAGQAAQAILLAGKSDLKSPVSTPSRSYADIVKNIKAPDFSPIRPNPSSTSNKFSAGSKSNCKRSFHDDCSGIVYGQILENDGLKHVSFSAKELEELVAPFEFSLVGKFSHGFPTMRTLRLIIGNLNLKGDFYVSLLDQKHVLIRLSCEEDYTRLWCRQVWYMAGYPMRVLKWTPGFTPRVEAPFAPVWVQFPYLPVHLFDRRSLFTIASILGKPLRIDSATADLTRASTPRVCIEIDVTKPCKPEVEIRLDGYKLIQAVEYENIPLYCSSCKHLGHALNECKSDLKPAEMVADGPPNSVSAAAFYGPQQQPSKTGLPSPVLVKTTAPCILEGTSPNTVLKQPTVAPKNVVAISNKLPADSSEQQPNCNVPNPLSVQEQVPLSVKDQVQNIPGLVGNTLGTKVTPAPSNTSAQNLSKSLNEQISNSGPFLSDDVTESEPLYGEKNCGDASQPTNQVNENVEKEIGRSGTDDEFYSDIEGADNNSFSEGEDKEKIVKERDRIFKPSHVRFKKPPRDNFVKLVVSTNKRKHKVQKKPD